MNRIYISVINDLETDQRVHKVAQTLYENGAEVTLIGRQLKDSLNHLQRDYQIHRFKLLVNNGFVFYALYNLRLFFFLFFKKKAVLLSNDLDTLLANYLVSKIRKVPLVYDSHEFFSELPELINRKLTRKVWLRIEKRLLPNLKNAYTVCQPIADEYKKRYGIEMQIVKNLPKRKDLESSSIIDKKVKVLLYQGSLQHLCLRISQIQLF